MRGGEEERYPNSKGVVHQKSRTRPPTVPAGAGAADGRIKGRRLARVRTIQRAATVASIRALVNELRLLIQDEFMAALGAVVANAAPL